jgi:hypothetical protein
VHCCRLVNVKGISGGGLLEVVLISCRFPVAKSLTIDEGVEYGSDLAGAAGVSDVSIDFA